MRLATIIAQCGLANYWETLWYISQPAWEALLEEARPFPAIHRALLRRRIACRPGSFSCEVHSQWKQYHKDVYAWFRGYHPRDWLGTIPRDILGIVHMYLHTYIRMPLGGDMVVTSLRAMASKARLAGEPTRVTITKSWATIDWDVSHHWFRNHEGPATYSARNKCVNYDLTDAEKLLCDSIYRVHAAIR